MAAKKRKPSKQRGAESQTNEATSLDETLKLVPSSQPHDRDAARAVNGMLVMVRAIMRDQFGVDPKLTNKPEHIGFALNLLATTLDEARARGGAPSSKGVGVDADRAERRKLREQKLRDRLVEVLRTHQGNVSEVARVMDKGRTQIRRWVERFGLDPEAFRDESAGAASKKS